MRQSTDKGTVNLGSATVTTLRTPSISFAYVFAYDPVYRLMDVHPSTEESKKSIARPRQQNLEPPFLRLLPSCLIVRNFDLSALESFVGRSFSSNFITYNPWQQRALIKSLSSS